MHVTDFFASVYNTPTPMLVFEATVGEEVISSDKTWSCKYLKGYEYRTYQMRAVPPYEAVKVDAGEVALPVVQKDRCEFRENGHFISGGAALTYLLQKRPIPMIYPGEEVEIKPIRSGDGFVEYDAGIYVTGKVRFEIEKNSSVKIIYAECYEFEDGKRRRDDTNGSLSGYYDEVKTAGENFVYEPFWFRAFRFIRVEGDWESIGSIKVYRVHYPFDMTGNFECSDESYNKMYEVSQNTILCCNHEIVTDCPYYEQQQYEFDSSVQLAIISRMSSDRRLSKKCINEFAYSQMPNGLLLSIYPASAVVQMIPGFSLMWVMMLKAYLENTADLEFVSGHVGTMDKLLGYFDREIAKRGYIAHFEEYWNFIDWVPEWNGGGKGGVVPLKADEVHTIYKYSIQRKIIRGL